MKNVYVIGAGVGATAIAHARKVLELSDDANTNIVCVSSQEDIPIEARFSSDAATIQRIHKITAIPRFCDTSWYDKRKIKSHERDYKYHK